MDCHGVIRYRFSLTYRYHIKVHTSLSSVRNTMYPYVRVLVSTLHLIASKFWDYSDRESRLQLSPSVPKYLDILYSFNRKTTNLFRMVPWSDSSSLSLVFSSKSDSTLLKISVNLQTFLQQFCVFLFYISALLFN